MTIPRSPRFKPSSLVARLGTAPLKVNFPEGHVFYAQGDPADAVFYIQRGTVKITVVSDQGKEAVVGLLQASDFFGEGCIAGQKIRVSSVTAMSDVTVVRMEKASVMRLLHEDSEFSGAFIAHLLDRAARVEADLVDQLFNSSEKRLARLLLLMANFGQDDEPRPVIAKVSQETLAQMIGTTRARVNFFMNKFRNLGLIDYNGDIRVHPSLLNAVLHEKPGIDSE